MKYYSYENFKVDTNTLIKKVESLHFEAIVAVARGGLTLSHAIAEGLDIRQVQSIRTELYDKSLKRERVLPYQVSANLKMLREFWLLMISLTAEIRLTR